MDYILGEVKMTVSARTHFFSCLWVLCSQCPPACKPFHLCVLRGTRGGASRRHRSHTCTLKCTHTHAACSLQKRPRGVAPAGRDRDTQTHSVPDPRISSLPPLLPLITLSKSSSSASYLSLLTLSLLSYSSLTLCHHSCSSKTTLTDSICDVMLVCVFVCEKTWMLTVHLCIFSF